MWCFFFLFKQKTAYEMRISGLESRRVLFRSVVKMLMYRHKIRLRPYFSFTELKNPYCGAYVEIEPVQPGCHAVNGPDRHFLGIQLDRHEALVQLHRTLQSSYGALRFGFPGALRGVAGDPAIAEVSAVLADAGYCGLSNHGLPVPEPDCAGQRRRGACGHAGLPHAILGGAVRLDIAGR